jgi:hypothetical protein
MQSGEALTGQLIEWIKKVFSLISILSEYDQFSSRRKSNIYECFNSCSGFVCNGNRFSLDYSKRKS